MAENEDRLRGVFGPTTPDGVAERLRKSNMGAALFGRPPEPVLIGRYQLVRLLGEGGMGAVFEATHEAGGPPVAIKLVRISSRGADARLLREGKALRKLSHPNLVEVLDVGRCDEGVYIAMSLVRGKTLRDWGSPLRPPDEVIPMIIAIAEGLFAAHEHGVIHRDIKPDNILVDQAGHPRVIDFGLVKAMKGSAVEDESTFAERLTATGTMMGSVGYTAPELLLAGAVGPAADQFSLAVTAWELLFGVSPFKGKTADGVALAIVSGRVRALTSQSRAADHCEAALRKALARAPESRHPSMRAFAAALSGESSANGGSWFTRLLDRR